MPLIDGASLFENHLAALQAKLPALRQNDLEILIFPK
jgi:hypothetical protein